MRQAFILVLLFTAGFALPAEDKATIVIFDFSCEESPELGEWIANNIRKKLQRQNLFIIIEDIDREEAVEAGNFHPDLKTPPEDVIRFAKGVFNADYAVWGEVKKKDQIEIALKAVKLENGKPRLLVDRTFTTRDQYTVRFVAWDFIDMLLKPYSRRVLRPTDEPPPDPEAELRWRTAPNLLKDEGFEKGTDHPLGWEPFGVDWQHGEAFWVKSPDGKGKCIKFVISPTIAASYGVAYYSDYIPIRQWATYRFSVRYLTLGPSVKVFCKAYAYFKPRGDEKEGQWREVYRRQINMKVKGKWHTRIETFQIRPDIHRKFQPKRLRIGLYAYWPAGVVYFDDCVLKEIKPPRPPADDGRIIKR